MKQGGDDGVVSRWIRWEPSIPRDGGIRPLSPVPGRGNDPVISVLLRHWCVGAKPRSCRVDRNVNRIVMSRKNRNRIEGQLRASQVTRSSFLWLASQCRFVPTKNQEMMIHAVELDRDQVE